MLSHHLHPKKLLEEIEGNYMVHCVQTLPSNGSEAISSKPFWCCFIFCLFWLHLEQSVGKVKGDESMKVSFGFTEAGAAYFTSKSLFHLFVFFFYLKRNWDSLQHFRLATPAYFVPQYGFSTSEKVRFFSLLQEASKRDSHSSCGPKSLRLRSSYAVLLEHPQQNPSEKPKFGFRLWHSRTDSPQPLCRDDPFAQLRNALGERQDLFC